jgi:hypothetical protein
MCPKTAGHTSIPFFKENDNMKKTTTCFVLGLLSLSGVAEAVCNSSIPLTRHTRYESVASATPADAGSQVRDKETGLVWFRCVLGMYWDGSTCAGTAKAYTWQAALEEARKAQTASNVAWRLPNQTELLSLAERACYDPAINLNWFPATPSNLVWSSSPAWVSSVENAWGVSFLEGNNEGYPKTNEYFVRLVRSDR